MQTEMRLQVIAMLCEPGTFYQTSTVAIMLGFCETKDEITVPDGKLICNLMRRSGFLRKKVHGKMGWIKPKPKQKTIKRLEGKTNEAVSR